MMKRKGNIIILMIILVMTFTSCGNKPVATDATEGNEPVSTDGTKTAFGITPLGEKQILRVAYFAGSPHANTFYVAEQKGFFKELNIEIEYLPIVNGPAMMEAYTSWDIGTTGGPGVIVGALAHGVKMIGVSDYEENLALFVRKDSAIYKSGKGNVPSTPDLYGKAEDWKGTKWLYPAGTNLHLVLVSALKKQGLALGDISSVNMDVTSALTAFKGGQGDGLAVWNAFAFAAEDAGFKRVSDAGKQGDINVCGLVATEDALENKRELIKKAWQVYYNTVEWSKSSPQNLQSSVDYYVESCDEQGILITEDIAKRALEYYKAPSLKENIDIMTKEVVDKEGKYTKRKLLQAENELNYTLDFFISQGNYTEEDRNKILDNKLVDNSITLEVKDELDK
jgi:ABC-type nitrate/sulfonate/bicarbonate transport system substrate-binding protein